MSRVDLRTRALDALWKATGGHAAAMGPTEIARARRGPDEGWTARMPRAIAGAAPAQVGITDDTLPGPAGPLPVRVYTPPAGAGLPHPLVVFLHGGGWVVGHHAAADWLCGQVAARVGAVVVSVGYRLAPEHRFPAAVADCLAATEWLAEHGARLGADPTRLAVFGESAGANLTAVLGLLTRDGGPRIALQGLVYPGLDATLSSPSVHAQADAPYLDRADLVAFLDHYVDPADRRDPRVSPLLAADLTGAPPALIQTAELDLLRDDGRRYGQALAAAGVPVRLTEYAAAPHGFYVVPGIYRAVARQALVELVEALQAALATG